MSDWVAVVTGVAIGVVSLGLLIHIFRVIFSALGEKVNKDVFEESTKDIERKVEKDVFAECIRRIDDQFESGKKQFTKIDQTLEKTNESVQELREATIALREIVGVLTKQNNMSIKGGFK